MNKLVLILFVCCIFFGAQAQPKSYSLLTDLNVGYTQLDKSFKNPPPESRLRCYWWWLNSMVTKESITHELEEMKAKGYGGASIVDAYTTGLPPKGPEVPVFMDERWMELYKHAVREADRLGIELSVNAGSGWNPGGPSITPEFAMKKIVWSEINITGGKIINMELPQPDQKLVYWDIMVQAIPCKEGLPIGDNAIENWSKKTFLKKLGWKGVYPLYELRHDFPGDGTELSIKKNEIIDLTMNYRDGKLEWDAPEGKWTIIRYGYTCTGVQTWCCSDGWKGLSVDHLSPAAFNLFGDTVIIPLIKAAQSAGQSVKFLQTDSWEMDMVSWTNRFPKEFRKFRGYDIQKYMPVMAGRIVENRDESNRFLHDYRKTIGDCVHKYHYQLFYNLAHEYGLGIHPESGGPHSAPVDALRIMGISDFPQGEFWATANTHRVKDDERLCVKQSACVAHTNGKRFVAAEGPTSQGPHWERSPKDLKGNIDRVFCSGINRIVWHTFTASPKEYGLPGNEYNAGTHLNPNVTWWEKSKDFISYLNRCSYMLQQGLYVADVLYYYGDDVPNFVFLKEELPELNFGYDWDKCSKEVIINRVEYDGKKIVLPDGMSYRLLMLAPEKSIDLNVLKKVESLVNKGLTLVAPRPEKVSGLSGFPHSDHELKAITDRLWGKIDGKDIIENKYGKGRVIWGHNINKVLAEMGAKPDFSFKSTQQETALDYIHHTTKGQEIYFVANRFARKGINDFTYRYLNGLPDRYEQVECTFRVSGKVPQLWDPKTGEIKEILSYREENGQTTVPLFIEPEGSVFVVFKDAPAQKHITAITKDGKNVFPNNQFETRETPIINIYKRGGEDMAVVYEPGTYTLQWSDGRQEVVHAEKPSEERELSGKWGLHFDPKWGGPEKIVIDELKSWIKFEEPGIKYYSGTARYIKVFPMTQKEIKGQLVMLDLGNVQEMALVKVNGHQISVLWSAPFRVDITPFVKPGDNELEVEVVNMWPNRMIGDSKLPENKRFTRTSANISKFKGPDAENYLRESGLLGPVKIKIIKQKKLLSNL